jgi:hypothetical protein
MFTVLAVVCCSNAHWWRVFCLSTPHRRTDTDTRNRGIIKRAICARLKKERGGTYTHKCQKKKTHTPWRARVLAAGWRDCTSLSSTSSSSTSRHTFPNVSTLLCAEALARLLCIPRLLRLHALWSLPTPIIPATPARHHCYITSSTRAMHATPYHKKKKCMYVCMHVCMYACMYVCMHIWHPHILHMTHTHTYIHTCKQACIHTYLLNVKYSIHRLRAHWHALFLFACTHTLSICSPTIPTAIQTPTVPTLSVIQWAWYYCKREHVL